MHACKVFQIHVREAIAHVCVSPSILTQSSDMFTKSCEMLNKNTLGVKKVRGQ